MIKTKKTLKLPLSIGRLLSIILSCCILTASIFVLAYADETDTDIQKSNETEAAVRADGIDGKQAYAYLENAVDLILTNYKFDVKTEKLYRNALKQILIAHPELLEEAFKGVFDSLDKFSVYFTQDELDAFVENLSGEFCGIGVVVMTVDNGLLVSTVYDHSPAQEVGLTPGDVITAVNGESIMGLDISIARGYIVGEAGTKVTLGIRRNDADFEVIATRNTVVIDSGFYQCLSDDTIGYISLNEFDVQAAEFTQKALDEFDKKEIKNIIIDLRNNPGGSLSELVDMCTLFIPAGPAIHLEFKDPLQTTTLYSENKAVKYNLEVLVNENSASAAEAFSAAVQDTGVGIVIGEQTYGKGTMQNLTHFKIGGGVKLTEAVYLTPNKRSINGIGVEPDLYLKDKITSYSNADFEPISYDRILQIGDTGKDVLAIEQRLYALGYSVGIPNEVYDEKTYYAAMSFQKYCGLYQYGVMDITTQLKLDAFLQDKEIENDTVLKKAIDIFENENWQEYKQDWTIPSDRQVRK